MLKTVSSITNAIGALNYKGTWNASTNTPTITSSVGVKGDYYVVSVAGSTTIDGISNWGVGDWITYNGTVWQRVEGGADLNGVNITFTGTASGPTYETSNAAAGLTITDNDITADGTDTNIDIDITPKGTGEVNLPKVDIDGGSIDGTAIGANSASSGAFTTLSASNTTNLSSLTASTALALDASKNVVSVTNTGTGNNVLSANPTISGALNLTGAASTATVRNSQASVSVTTSATNISPAFAAGFAGALVIVYGNAASVDIFIDLIICPDSGTPTVLHSTTVAGSPAARTYSTASSTLRLAMASGTYAVNTTFFRIT